MIATTDGLVRAMVGGRDYGASQFNRATDAARQPGSSFKIFVYMTALLTGKYHGDTPIDASSVCIGDYCVHNYHGESGGVMPLYKALAESFNTAAIRMSIKIGEAYWPAKQSYHLGKIAALGRSKIVETARAMGVTTPLVDTVSLPVGADEVKLIDMVGANATLASGGVRVTPYAAVEIRNSNGKLIYTHAEDNGRPGARLPADKVAEMNNIMTHVVTEGTGRAAQIPGLVISGKTGTTNNSTNAWFNAFTGNLVGSVWFGNDDNAPMENMTGGTLPAMTWREIMVFAHQDSRPSRRSASRPRRPPRARRPPAPWRKPRPKPPRLRRSRSVFRRARPRRSSISAIWRATRSGTARARRRQGRERRRSERGRRPARKRRFALTGRRVLRLDSRRGAALIGRSAGDRRAWRILSRSCSSAGSGSPSACCSAPTPSAGPVPSTACGSARGKSSPTPARPRPTPTRGPISREAARSRWRVGEGLQLIARVDDGGRALDARCVYTVGPRVPAARYWTLSLIDPDGWPIENPAERYGFRSSEILRAANGDFVVTVAAAHNRATGCRSAAGALRARPSALRFAARRDRRQRSTGPLLRA